MDSDPALPPISLRAFLGTVTREPNPPPPLVPSAPPPTDSPFRMAVMQSLRNSNPRRSQRYRTHWQDWSNDRERDYNDDTSMPRLEWGDGSSMGPHQAYLRQRRELTSATGTLNLPPASYQIAEAIRYLNKIRTSSSAEESLRFAKMAGFYSGDNWLDYLQLEDPELEGELLHDFVLDTRFLRVAETSWLKVGGVFWGTQTTPPASPAAPTSTHRRSSHFSPSSLPSNATAGAPSGSRDSYRSSSSVSGDSESAKNTSRWTVKVSISSIDYDEMRLSWSSLFPSISLLPGMQSILIYLYQRAQWKHSQNGKMAPSIPTSKAKSSTSTNIPCKPLASRARLLTTRRTGANWSHF